MKESLVVPRLFIYEPHLDYLVQRSHLPAVDRFLPQNTWWDDLVYYLICDLMAGTNETEGYITSCENASVPFQSWQLLFSAAAGEKVLALANVRDLCPINGIRMPHLLHNHIQTETDHNLERKCTYKPLSNVATSAIRGQSKTTVVATVHHKRNVPKMNRSINTCINKQHASDWRK